VVDRIESRDAQYSLTESGGADAEHHGIFYDQPGGAGCDNRLTKVRADIAAAIRNDPNLPGGLIRL
jgi:hypothetical protein